MIPSHRRTRLPGPGRILPLAVVGWLLAAPAAAQVPLEIPDHPRIKIFSLKHENPESLVEVIEKFFGDLVVLIPHHATNSLVVQAAGDAEWRSIEDLIRQLDVEPPAKEEPPSPPVITRSYNFQNAKLDNNLANHLRQVLGNYGQFAVDVPRNLVIFQAHPDNLPAIEGVLSELDRNLKDASEKKSSGKLIRVLWLLGGAPEGQLSQPPEDLAVVVTELSLLGIDRLGMVAQTLVQGIDEQDFQLTSNPELDGSPCSLHISGRVFSKPDELNELQIMVSASQALGINQRLQLADLSTKVLAPSGHHVVLCVSPVGERTSVFVVQVRNVERAN